MAFEPGETAAGRFRIERFVARGAMGEIWEATDLELGERVALKTIRAEMSRDERTAPRFKREIQLARRVTHVNVCRIFDLWVHEAPSSASAPPRRTLFLTMEYLEGETLEQRLGRSGRLRPDEALHIARQVAEGLAAAHENGIIHRDLKSGNVMLVPASGPEDPERVVLADFGLALVKGLPIPDPFVGSDPGDAGDELLPARHATVGRLQGTPAYMAPEQVRGDPITPATDVYAFGLVLFEMVTGSLPWIEGTPLEVAQRRLVEAPASPRGLVPELDPRWEAAILRCLEREPGARFASCREVIAAITGTETAGRRRTVAVAWFADSTSGAGNEWISTALGDLLSRRLVTGDDFAVVGPDVVAEITRDLGAEPTAAPSPELRRRLREQLGAGLLLTGEIEDSPTGRPGEILWHLRVEDTATGQTIAGVAEAGDPDALVDLVERTALRLQEALGLDLATAGERGRLRAAYPVHAAAAADYARATVLLRFGSAREARHAFETVIEQDPGFPLAYRGLAEAAHELGYEDESVQAAQRAFQLSGGLGREERLLVEARFRFLAHDHARAIDIYRSLWILHPEELEHGLRLLRAQVDAGLGAAARATATALRALPAPGGDDPRIDVGEARACQAAGAHADALAIATRARLKAENLESPSLLAHATEIGAGACQRLGRQDEARIGFETALAAFRGQENAGGETRCRQLLGGVLREQGRIDEARESFEAGLQTARRVGRRQSEAALLGNLSVMAVGRRDFETAISLGQEALAIQRVVGDRRGQAQTLNTLLTAYRGQGDSIRLHQAADEGIALARDTDSFELLARLLANRVIVLTKGGDLAQARASMEEARALLPRLENQNLAGVVHSAVAQFEVLAGNLAGAAHGYAEAVRLARAGGSQPNLAIMLASLAWAQVTMGDIRSARESLNEGLALADQLRAVGTRALLLQISCEVSVAEGSLDEAAREIAESIALFEGKKENWNLGESYLAASQIALERGLFTQALEFVDRSIQWNLDLEQAETEALARAFRARLLLGLDRADEAEAEIARAREILARQSNRQRHSDIQVGLCSARVHTAFGRHGEARRTADETLARATESGFVILEFEARFLVGEVALAAGDLETSRQVLQALAREAALRGHRRAADEARQLLDSIDPKS